jgi:hypothetical protein
MNLTSSLIEASFLAQPGIDHRLDACCRACVENVPDRLLVEPDQGDIATSALKRWHLISGPWLSQVLARPRRGGVFRLRGTLGLAWSGWRPGRLEAV